MIQITKLTGYLSMEDNYLFIERHKLLLKVSLSHVRSSESSKVVSYIRILGNLGSGKVFFFNINKDGIIFIMISSMIEIPHKTH